eukprot:c2754_g1_i1.p1 GENE.c2754_g1_i1~~c2754_g1_i1.p1  ORF type:complete len:366 (+),score=90.82 c2754_g1_i1:71-1168(+)
MNSLLSMCIYFFLLFVVCQSNDQVIEISVDGSQNQQINTQNQATRQNTNAKNQTRNNDKQHVAFSFTQDTHYIFYAPITAAAYRHLGFDPILLMVETPYANQRLIDLVSKYAKNWAGVRVHPIKALGGAVTLTSQVGRMFAACTRHLSSNSSIMISDVDMLVLDSRIYGNWNKANPAHYTGYYASYITVGAGQRPQVDDDPWNDEGVSGKWTMLQMCFVDAQVWVWRQALDLPASGCSISSAIADTLSRDAKDVERVGWAYDQHLLTTAFTKQRKILKASGLDMDLHCTDYRSEPYLQMDGRFRNWDNTVYGHGHDFAPYSTAHLPRNGYQQDKWDITLRMLRQRFGPAFATVAEAYHKEFLENI